MRVFLSFARSDAKLAAELGEALRRRHIDSWSSLDLKPGEELRPALERESAKTDGFLFLVEPDGAADAQLRNEWRSLLWSDWDGSKTMIPIVNGPGNGSDKVPPFLRNQKVLYASNLGDVAERVERFLQHPAEMRDPERDKEAEAEFELGRNELREFALSLKEEARREREESDSR